MGQPGVMRDTAIEVADLRCIYGDFEAVTDVGFSVGRGELFALLGTNGAGKTTTMEVLEGHRAPASGRVRVLGRDPRAERSEVRKHVGIMLQESGFAGDLTVAETIRMWRSMITGAGRSSDALERVGLGQRADVRTKQLSGGEKRRLDLALATLGQPEVLFLDEPTTGLDPESRAETWQVVRDLLERGTTVLLTTHYLEEAERLADRLAIMHEGRLAVSGSLVEVLEAEQAVISFAMPDAELPPLRGTVPEPGRRSGPAVIRTPRLQDDLSTLLRWADDHGITLSQLRAQHASLDEVFSRVVAGNYQGQKVETPA